MYQVPFQGNDSNDCGIFTILFMYHLIHHGAINTADVREDWHIPEDEKDLTWFRLRFAQMICEGRC